MHLMLFPSGRRQVRLYRPLPVRNLPSIKMPVCEECKGDGSKDGYICTTCKGKGTVEALVQTVRSFSNEVQYGIYNGVSKLFLGGGFLSPLILNTTANQNVWNRILHCLPSCQRHQYSPLPHL
jgi:hypothetical protein